MCDEEHGIGTEKENIGLFSSLKARALGGPKAAPKVAAVADVPAVADGTAVPADGTAAAPGTPPAKSSKAVKTPSWKLPKTPGTRKSSRLNN